MKERPILFSGPMVRAIFDREKTQTRRIVKHQGDLKFLPVDGSKDRSDPENWLIEYKKGWWEGLGRDCYDGINVRPIPCPYGEDGDRLWVRETWGIQAGIRACATDTPNRWNGQFWEPVTHRAGTENYAWGMYGPPKWKPSIHMPRTGCRIVLEVISVRVERLHDISEEDAKAEGMVDDSEAAARFLDEDFVGSDHWTYDPAVQAKNGGWWFTATAAFGALWSSINGPGSWAANPWVWVVEFKRIQP